MQHPVGQGQAGRAVGDQQHGALVQQVLAFVDEFQFPGRVEHRRGLVQHQHRRIAQQRPGQRQALLLPAGQLHPLVADHRGVALRQGHDEVVGTGGVGGAFDLRRIRVGPSVGDVSGHGVVEQQHLLGHHAHLGTQRGQGHLAKVDAVDQDAPGLRFQQPLQQVRQGALAGAVGAGQGHRLAGAHLQVQAVEQGRPPRVGEADALEGDRTGRVIQHHRAVVAFGRRHQRLQHPLQRPARGLGVAVQL